VLLAYISVAVHCYELEGDADFGLWFVLVPGKGAATAILVWWRRLLASSSGSPARKRADYGGRGCHDTRVLSDLRWLHRWGL